LTAPLIEKGRRLYPALSKTERAAKFDEPLDEILGDLAPPRPGTDAWWAERKAAKDAAYERSLKQFYDVLATRNQLAAAIAKGDLASARKLRKKLPSDPWDDGSFPVVEDQRDLERRWAVWDSMLHPYRRKDWADVSKPVPRADRDDGNRYVTGTPQQWWRYRHRGALSALRMADGTKISFGYAPSLTRDCVYRIVMPPESPFAFETITYLGYLPGKAGRPPKPNKLSNADKQRAYRQRKKTKRKD
jgi:hypothetical protein